MTNIPAIDLATITKEELRLIELNRQMLWVPQPGPQLDAYLMAMSGDVDELLFGGSVGGGKSALAVGLACTWADKTLYLRREFAQLTPVVDYLAEVIGNRDGFNSQTKVWRLKNRQIRFGGVSNAGDEQKYQGAERTLTVLDEASQFLPSQIDFLTAWNRSAKGRKTLTLFATNPPQSAEGYWVTERFAPWVDPDHPEPAKPGEIRTINGIRRTFIESKLEDNRYLNDGDYKRRLEGLPDELKATLLDGSFTAARADDEFQCIPGDWIREAMNRWEGPPEGEVTSAGCDPSRGGRDTSVICLRHGWHYDQLIEVSDSETGANIAAKLLEVAGPSAPLHIDVIGIGSSVVDFTQSYVGTRCVPVNGAESPKRSSDMTGNLKFANRRAEVWWNMREMLSPQTPGRVILPPDTRLAADLAAPRYKLTPSGLLVEKKEDVIRRLGRSPDRGDAVCYAGIRSPGVVVNHARRKRFR